MISANNEVKIWREVWRQHVALPEQQQGDHEVSLLVTAAPRHDLQVQALYTKDCCKRLRISSGKANDFSSR